MPRARAITPEVDNDLVDDESDSPRAFRRRPKGTRQPSGKVHHWAQVWYGKTEAGNASQSWYTWTPAEDDIEVVVQEYGEPRWFEELQSAMIKASKELIDEGDAEFSAVRLRVRLFSHQPDGEDARFTLEHIRKR